MSFGEKQLQPLEIDVANEAAHKASELQREVEDQLRRDSAALAEAERAYRKALSIRIVELRAEQVAVTACADIARGEKKIADLRYERDVAQGIMEATRQQCFRRGSDRRDLDTLLNWSMRRDLRTDTPPAGFDRPRAVA